MGKVRVAFKGVARPQMIAGLLVMFLIGLGYLATPTIIRPIQAATPLPVIKPVTPRVESATLATPLDCAKMACIALTFDDGPDGRLTPLVLDILERHSVKATFFVLGSHVAGNEALLRRMHQGGHEIGNHSWGHPYLTQISLEQVDKEVSDTQAAITAAGVPAPHIFRPPYGDINETIASHIPLSIIRWNIDPEDWHPKKRARMLEHLAAYAKPGSMVLLHDTEETTVGALEPLILQLKAGNYTFVTASELLNIPPGQPGVFFGR